MSLAPSQSGPSRAAASRQQFGAMLMLVAMALLTALFWAGIIRALV